MKDMTPTLHAGSCVTAAVPKARRPSHSSVLVRAGGSKQAKSDTNENDSSDQDCSVNPDELHLDHVAAIKRGGIRPLEVSRMPRPKVVRAPFTLGRGYTTGKPSDPKFQLR
jgi:hypothetical protein